MVGCLRTGPNTTQVRYITPPRLEETCLGTRIVCYRPVRHGSPAFFIEKKDGQYIVHNYGHGGNGWTLGPGAASYVIDLLQQQIPDEVTKTSNITVVGAGVLGLLTALELVKRGYRRITMVADQFDNLTSHNAGGLLATTFLKTDNHTQNIINDMAIYSYRFYAQIVTGCHPLVKKGAARMSVYLPYSEADRFDPYVAAGVMQPGKKVNLDFRNGTIRSIVGFDDGIFMDIGVLMQSLADLLRPYVTFKKQKIARFGEINTKIIINCTGWGAKDLANDTHVTAAIGHLILLKNQDPNHLKYMLSVHSGPNYSSPNPATKRFLCVFPKRMPGALPGEVGVIGGTYHEDTHRPLDDTNEFDLILQRAKQFYGLREEKAPFNTI